MTQDRLLREYALATGVALAVWRVATLLAAVALALEPLAWRVVRGWVG